MKYIKLRIRHVEDKRGGGRFEYPPGYDAQKVKIGPVYFWEEAKGSRYCDIIFGVLDGDFPQFIGAHEKQQNGHTFLAMEVLEQDCIDAFNKYEPVTTTGTVTNQEKVINILAKHARGVELTEREKDAINPEHPEAGINAARRWEVLIPAQREMAEAD